MSPSSFGGPGMDVLTASATVVALLGVQNTMWLGSNDPETENFPFLESLFIDISKTVATLPFAQGRSTQQALAHCEVVQERLRKLLDSLGFKTQKYSDKIVHRVSYRVRFYLKRRKLRRAKADYYNAVVLLRDIVMDTVTHKHLEYIKTELDWHLDRVDGVSLSVPTIYEGATTPTFNTPKSLSEPFSGPPVSPTGTLVPSSRPELRHKTSGRLFDARIMRVCECDVNRIPARGLFDTGSDENFLSQRFLAQNRLGDVSLTALDREKHIDSLQGMSTSIKFKATVHWYMEDSAKEHITEFLVAEDDRFDLLVGNVFIEQNRIFKRKDSSPVFMMTTAAQRSSKGKPDAKKLAEKFRQDNNVPIDLNMLGLLNQRGQWGSASRISQHARTASAAGSVATDGPPSPSVQGEGEVGGISSFPQPVSGTNRDPRETVESL
ncbi:hypothetical protein OQA88_2294 [Cercophora sp. LCS_1]